MSDEETLEVLNELRNKVLRIEIELRDVVMPYKTGRTVDSLIKSTISLIGSHTDNLGRNRSLDLTHI